MNAAALKTTRATQAKCTVRAPFPAIVLERLAQEGEMASAGAPLASLLDTSRIEVRAEIQEADIAALPRARNLALVTAAGRYPLRLTRVSPALGKASRLAEARLRFHGNVAVPGASGRVVWASPGNACTGSPAGAPPGTAWGVRRGCCGQKAALPVPAARSGGTTGPGIRAARRQPHRRARQRRTLIRTLLPCVSIGGGDPQPSARQHHLRRGVADGCAGLSRHAARARPGDQLQLAGGHRRAARRRRRRCGKEGDPAAGGSGRQDWRHPLHFQHQPRKRLHCWCAFATSPPRCSTSV